MSDTREGERGRGRGKTYRFFRILMSDTRLVRRFQDFFKPVKKVSYIPKAPYLCLVLINVLPQRPHLVLRS